MNFVFLTILSLTTIFDVSNGNAGPALSEGGMWLAAFTAISLLSRSTLQDARIMFVRIETIFYSLATIVIMVGLGVLNYGGGDSYDRVELFFSNPNTLGASLSMLGIISLISTKNTSKMLLALHVTLVSIVFTGSRSGLVAYVVGVLVWITITRRAKWVLVYMAALLSGVISFSLLTSQYITSVDAMLSRPNILETSTLSYEGSWLIHSDADIKEISHNAEEGPLPGTQATRLVARSGSESRLLVYQNAGRAISDEPYIGSVYLRANKPHEIILSTQLGKVVCEVTVKWQRCVTPVGYGNPTLTVQLRVETREPGQEIDLLLWGAQVEIGNVVSDIHTKYTPSLFYRLAKRFNYQVVDQRTDIVDRHQIFESNWRLFQENVLIGVRDPGDRSTHAHNMFLELLVTGGILKLLSWSLMFFCLTFSNCNHSWVSLLPVLATLLLLNSLDYTYYSAGVFYPYWCFIAICCSSMGES